jgi:NADPH2:quinone reductase
LAAGIGWPWVSRRGRYLIIGFAGGSVPHFPANRLLVKNRRAIGFALMYYRKQRPDLLGQCATALCELCEGDQIDPHVGQIIELGAAGEAIDAYLERRVAGATVVRIEP